MDWWGFDVLWLTGTCWLINPEDLGLSHPAQPRGGSTYLLVSIFLIWLLVNIPQVTNKQCRSPEDRLAVFITLHSHKRKEPIDPHRTKATGELTREATPWVHHAETSRWLMFSLLQSIRCYWAQWTKVSSGTHPLSSASPSDEAVTAGPPVELPESILNRSQILYLCKSRNGAAMNSVVCITPSESPPRHPGHILHAPFQCRQMTDTWDIHLHGWRGNDTTARGFPPRPQSTSQKMQSYQDLSWSDEHC